MGFIIFGLFLGILLVVAQYVFVAYKNDMSDDSSTVKRKVKKANVVLALLVPVLLMTAIASVTSVGTGQIAVMTRYGRVTGEELKEGIHFKNPIDKANVYDIKVQKEQTEASAASKDLQDVKATVVVNYDIEAGKVSEIHRTVGVLFKEKLIDPAIQEVIKGATAKFNATELITERPSVKAEAFDALKARLEPYGIQVRDLSLTNFNFSPEFTNAIEAKQVAQQQSEQAKFNADKAANDAQAAINRAKGEAESQQLLNSTASDKTIELKRLEVQQSAINKWNGILPTTQAGDGINFLLQPKQ